MDTNFVAVPLPTPNSQIREALTMWIQLDQPTEFPSLILDDKGFVQENGLDQVLAAMRIYKLDDDDAKKLCSAVSNGLRQFSVENDHAAEKELSQILKNWKKVLAAASTAQLQGHLESAQRYRKRVSQAVQSALTKLDAL